MLVDGGSIPAEGRLETDVCVVGAGPAGLAIGCDLRDAPFKVCVIDSGGRAPEKSSRPLLGGESVGQSYFALDSTRIRAVGGTSNHWYHAEGFRVRELDPIDFESRDAVPHSGWPFDHHELRPYYDRAHGMLGVGPAGYDPAEVADVRGSLLPLVGDEVVDVVFRIINGSGVMHHADELIRSDNVTLMTHTTVVELCSDEAPDRISHLRAVRPDGSAFNIYAKQFVLAAGGIENARLLLLSRRWHRDGIGNEHGLVGRFFMEHLGIRGGTLLPLHSDFIHRIGAYTTGPLTPGHVSVQAKLALSARVLRDENLLNAVVFLVPMGRARATQAVRSFVILRRALRWRPLPPDLRIHIQHALLGLNHVIRASLDELSSRRAPEVVQLHFMAEQSPNPDSRITLSDRKDPFGQRMARLDWRTTEEDWHSIVRTEQIIDRCLQSSGIGRVRGTLSDPSVHPQVSGQWHHLGTTRMHDDPKQGVVDATGRVHALGNLHLTGGSVFTTGGYANPTLTIVALAHRLADRIRTVMGSTGASDDARR
jgi:choline dehydrogenase-like flavoprotein